MIVAENKVKTLALGM
jgi:hypothetical protein